MLAHTSCVATLPPTPRQPKPYHPPPTPLPATPTGPTWSPRNPHSCLPAAAERPRRRRFVTRPTEVTDVRRGARHAPSSDGGTTAQAAAGSVAARPCYATARHPSGPPVDAPSRGQQCGWTGHAHPHGRAAPSPTGPPPRAWPPRQPRPCRVAVGRVPPPPFCAGCSCVSSFRFGRRRSGGGNSSSSGSGSCGGGTPPSSPPSPRALHPRCRGAFHHRPPRRA